MANRRFKITKEDNYILEIINDKQAMEIFASDKEEIFILYDDDSEGLVETEEELMKAIERGCTLGIGLGFVSREKENMESVQNIKGYSCLSCEDKDGNVYSAVVDLPFSEMKVLRNKFPNNVSIEILTSNVNLNFDMPKRTGLTAEKEFEMDADRLGANRVIHNDTDFLEWFKAEVAYIKTKDEYLSLVDMAEEIISVYNKVANPDNRNIKGQIFHIKDDFNIYSKLLDFDEMSNILSNIDTAETDYIGYKGGDVLEPISHYDIYHWINIFSDLMVSYVVHHAYEDDCRVLYEKYVKNGIREY